MRRISWLDWQFEFIRTANYSRNLLILRTYLRKSGNRAAHAARTIKTKQKRDRIYCRAAILAANHKETAAKIATLQFLVIDEIGPILPLFDQSRAHGIFPDIEPFGLQKFILSQQTIEDSILPPPVCVGLTSHETFQASRKLGDPRLPILYRADQCMKVIRHRNCSGRVPILVSAAERFDRLKGWRVIEHRPAILDAQGNEVADDLVLSEPNGYARRRATVSIVGRPFCPAKEKETAAKIAALQFLDLTVLSSPSPVVP